VIANQTKSDFQTLSAVLAGKAELREVIEQAVERRRMYGKRTILFVNRVVDTLNCHAAGVVLPAEFAASFDERALGRPGRIGR
jgi:replication-associated recombination protein RarA